MGCYRLLFLVALVLGSIIPMVIVADVHAGGSKPIKNRKFLLPAYDTMKMDVGSLHGIANEETDFQALSPEGQMVLVFELAKRHVLALYPTLQFLNNPNEAGHIILVVLGLFLLNWPTAFAVVIYSSPVLIVCFLAFLYMLVTGEVVSAHFKGN